MNKWNEYLGRLAVLQQKVGEEEAVVEGEDKAQLEKILGGDKATYAPVGSFVPLYVQEAFANFKTKFNRVYEGEEHEYRLSVFHDNLKYIEEFNAAEEGVSSVRVGITEFADLTHDEFKMMYVGEKIELKPESERNIIEENNAKDVLNRVCTNNYKWTWHYSSEPL